MSKGKTISTRWTEWTNASPIWARIALGTFISSILCLGLHLAVLHGLWRTVGLYGLIILAVCTQTIMFFQARKYPTVWWWFWFHAYVVTGVVVFEISSYLASVWCGV
jgi:hypothetical protein